MKPKSTSQVIWKPATGNVATLLCLLILGGWYRNVALAQSSVIHVYESGGAAALGQALTNIAEGGTIYVHSGTYDLGATANSFLSLTKAVTIVGLADGLGQPVIQSARPSGTAGVIFVNAPGKAITLENLEISYYGTRALGTVGFAVQVQGSNSFTVQNCTITAAFFDGTINRGIYGAIGIGGPPQSEFPVLPYPPTPASVANVNYPLRNSVKGEISIRHSALTAWITDVGIGIYGPVSLDKIEISHCQMSALGATQFGNWNRGDVGIGITQYPVYMTDANRPALLNATHTGTQTIISENTISVSNPIGLIYVKGQQWIEKNQLNSLGAWYYSPTKKYIQRGILALGYPHDVNDAASYSEIIIRNNVLAFQVPPFPIAGTSFTPPQTTANTSPVTGIWLGGNRQIYTSLSNILGHHARAIVMGNILTTLVGSPASTRNLPDYGLLFQNEMKNCVITGNHLAGGRQVDPLDGVVKSVAPFTAKVAQVYVGPEAHDNYFGSRAQHAWPRLAGSSQIGRQESWECHLPTNIFGAAGIAGVLCYGQNNQFQENQFYGDYRGWEPATGPGLYWLTDSTYYNRIGPTRLNGRGLGFNPCSQIYDETDWGWKGYQGLNFIVGAGRCPSKSADFVRRMQTLRHEIESQLETF
ncbi:MAG: hypothetical protein U0Y68_10390 [Blastocatellia bacterium]